MSDNRKKKMTTRETKLILMILLKKSHMAYAPVLNSIIRTVVVFRDIEVFFTIWR